MNLCPDAWQRPRSRGLIATSCDGGHPTFQWRKLSMAITTTPTSGSGARVRVQKFGTFLSNMVMPNIGAFIAWGFITALFIQVGWINLGGGDNAWLADNSWVAKIGGWGDFADTDGGLVGKMITYL